MNPLPNGPCGGSTVVCVETFPRRGERSAARCARTSARPRRAWEQGGTAPLRRRCYDHCRGLPGGRSSAGCGARRLGLVAAFFTSHRFFLLSVARIPTFGMVTTFDAFRDERVACAALAPGRALRRHRDTHAVRGTVYSYSLVLFPLLAFLVWSRVALRRTQGTAQPSTPIISLRRRCGKWWLGAAMPASWTAEPARPRRPVGAGPAWRFSAWGARRDARRRWAELAVVRRLDRDVGEQAVEPAGDVPRLLAHEGQEGRHEASCGR